jgi:dTDP-4-dehydrorhamnose reductase
MDVMIMGASGLVGQYLVREWTEDSIRPLTSKDLDIRNATGVEQIVGAHRPDWIVLAAAYTDVDGCESNPKLAFDTNTTGARNVAQAAQRHGARLLFLSTDYVFDGTKSRPYDTDDPRDPQTVYGQSKADAEVGMLNILPSACIVRTSWVFGTAGRCFPETLFRLAESRHTIDVVDDQRGCPTYARDLASAIKDLCHKNAHGIVHVTNTGACSWFEFATEIARQAGLPTAMCPTTTDRFPRPAKRPKYSVLSPVSRERLGIFMAPWNEALREYLEERRRPA